MTGTEYVEWSNVDGDRITGCRLKKVTFVEFCLALNIERETKLITNATVAAIATHLNPKANSGDVLSNPLAIINERPAKAIIATDETNARVLASFG
jgi:hypothetical protein